jgi:O-antigen/teichoic acid export membrane protein
MPNPQLTRATDCMLIRSTSIYATAVVLPRIAAFVLMLALTRLLSPAEFGFYALSVLIGEIADMIGADWIRLALLRLDSHSQSLRPALCQSARLTVVTVLAATLLAAIAARYLAPERLTGFAIAVAAYVIANSFARLGLTGLRMQQQSTRYAVVECLRSVTTVAAAVGTALLVSRSFVANSLATSSITVLFAMVSLKMASGQGASESAQIAATVRERLQFGAPIIVLSIAAYAISGADRVFLKFLTDPSTLGIYSAAYAIGRQPIDMVANAVNLGGFPELVRRYDLNGHLDASRFLGEQLAFMLLLTLPICILLALLASPLLELLLPPSYREIGCSVLPYVTVGAVLFSVKHFVFDNVFLLVKRNWLQACTYLPAVLTAFVVNPLLIRAHGASGAAMSFCLVGAIGLATSCIVSSRLLRPSLDLSHLMTNLLTRTS